MNGQRLWAGYDYAYVPSRGRGQRFSAGVQRIKVVRSYKRKQYGNKNATTFAEVTFLDWDGQPTASQASVEVEAYDIVDFWQDYYGEFQVQLDRIKDQREFAARKEQIESEQQARIMDMLAIKGIDRSAVGITGSAVIIQKNAMLSWLGIPKVDPTPTPVRTT